MHKKSRTFSLASAALLAILVAVGSVAVTPEVFAQQKPSTMRGLFEDGASKIQNQEYQKGIEVLDDLKRKFGNRLSEVQRGDIDFLRATAYYNMEKWSDAEGILRDFHVLYPNDKRVITAQISLADVYMRQSKWKDAREQLFKLSKNSSLSQAEKMRMEVVRADVIQKEAEATGDEETVKKGLATAENLLKTILAGVGNTPEAIDAKLRLVQIYLKLGKRNEAEALKSEIDSSGSKDPASIIRSNMQGLSLGDNYFQQAIDLEGSEDEQSRELFRDALSRYQRVLRKNALVEYFTPAIDAARKKLEAVKAKIAETTEEPNDAQAAQIEKLQEELDELEAFKSDFVENKDYDALISFRIGACLISLNRPWEAYVAFGDVVDNHKEFTQITLSTYYYILCLRQLGRNEDAQRACKAFIEKHPQAEEIGEVALMLGQISFEQGDYIGAIENFAWAKKNVPNLDPGTKCALDWYTITAWFARCPWGLGVKQEDIAGMGKPGYVPKLTQATQDTIQLIDTFIKDYGSNKMFGYEVEEMQYRKGLLYFYSGFYRETVDAMTTYLNDHPQGRFAPDARYRMAITKFGARYKDKAKDMENLEQVFVDCRNWLKDYFENTDANILNENFAAPLRKELPFSKREEEEIRENLIYQRPEVYTLMGDAYKRIAESIKPGKGQRKLNEADVARKENATNNMIRAYIIAAKTSGNNETTLDFALGEVDKHLPQRGEWDRLLDIYNALYDRNPDAPQALMYLNKKIQYTERAARAKGEMEYQQAKQESKKILAGAILKNFNDPAQDNVEELINQLAQTLAYETKRKKKTVFVTDESGVPVKTSVPNDYTPAKAAEEMLALLQLDSPDPDKKPTLIGMARGTYARATIYEYLRNDEECARYLQNIAVTYKPDELSPTILGKVGEFLENKGEDAKAEPFYRYLMDNYRSSSYADYGFAGVGNILLKQKNYRKAYEVFNDALENQVAYMKEFDLRLGRVKTLINMAKEDLAQLEISDPLGKAYADLNIIAAVKEWKPFGGNAAALYYKGQIEERRNKPNEAVTNYRLCYLTQKRHVEYAAPAMLRAGILFEEKLGQPDAAAQIYYEMTMPNSRYKDTPSGREAARRALKLPYTPPVAPTPAAQQPVAK